LDYYKNLHSILPLKKEMRLNARKFSDVKIIPIRSSKAVNGISFISEDVQTGNSSEENFGDLFFENSQIIMFSHDLEGNFITCNNATCQTFGFTIEEFTSKKLIDFIAKDALFDLKSYFSDLNNFGFSKGQVEVISENGAKLTCIFKNKLQKTSSGSKVVLVSLIDISDRVLLEKDILKQKTLAEKNAELKSVFLSNLTHEIRTPMAAITGFGRLLNDTELSPEQKEYTQALNLASSNMLKMVNDILDSTKIEAGQLTLEKITFDIYEEIQNLRKILNNLAKTKDIQLICEIEKGIDTQIIGDSVRLNQILMNLLGNAIKFTERGFVKIEVKKLKETKTDISLDFIVSDSGIGIAANKTNSIFERFNQANDDTSRKYGGTGLGLSISKSLVELQGGKILVESKLGKGSTFSFMLRFEKSANTDVKPEIKSLGTKTKVLLVEDNILNQKLATKILEKLGYQTLLVSNAADAFTILKSENIVLILMDLQLPDINGKDAAKHIKIKMGLDIPIIAISTNKPADLESEKLFADFIAKPFEPGEILRKIHSYTRKKVLNLSYLNSVSEGNLTFEKEILDSALEIIPAEIINLKDAFKTENFEEISNIAHKLKSTYTILGVDAEIVLNKLESINKMIDRNATNLLVDIELLHMSIVQNIRIELKGKFKNA
jgi:PAS domain S-box-containing protein